MSLMDDINRRKAEEEYQKKTDDFPTIALSSAELSLLKEANSNEAINKTNSNSGAFTRLYSLRLIVPISTIDISICKISNRGKGYLEYQNSVRKNKRADIIKQILIGTIISIISFALGRYSA